MKDYCIWKYIPGINNSGFAITGCEEFISISSDNTSICKYCNRPVQIDYTYKSKKRKMRE